MSSPIFIWCLIGLGAGSLSLSVKAIDSDEVTLLVYTQASPGGTEVALSDANKITEVSPFDTSLKTMFYVHGWQNNVNDQWVTMVRKSLINNSNVNFLTVNWDTCAQNVVYSVSQACVGDVGTYVGQFIANMTETYSYSKDDITVVGHSLGAHIAGYVGKTTNGDIGVIIGLDPAGPLFYKAVPSKRLAQGDAQYVLGVHTDTTSLGVSYSLGDADFWPNGGSLQNGCVTLDSICSHLRAVVYYSESVHDNQFYARSCTSYSNFKAGSCSANTKGLMASVDVDTTLIGSFYLYTNAQSLFGMGDVV